MPTNKMPILTQELSATVDDSCYFACSLRRRQQRNTSSSHVRILAAPFYELAVLSIILLQNSSS